MNRLMIAVIAFLSVLLSSPGWHSVAAQEESTQQFFSSCEVGIGGQVVLGHWVPIRLNDVRPPESCHAVGLTTLDGSGHPHRYLYRKQQGSSFKGVVRFGRDGGGVLVEFLDKDDKVLGSKRVAHSTLGQSTTFRPSISPVFLSLGSDLNLGRVLGIERIGDERADSIKSIYVDDLTKLPGLTAGYNSIQTIFISTSDLPQIQQMTLRQVAAILEWVRQGGRLIYCCGRNSQELLGEGQLLADFDIAGVTGLGTIDSLSLIHISEPTRPY